MMTFWIFVALMLVAALSFILIPLMKAKHSTGPDAEELNVLLHRQRLQELHDDRDSGLLSDSEFDEAYEELSQQVLQDLDGNTAPTSKTGASTDRWLGALLTISVPAVSMLIYFQLGTPEALSSRHNQVVADADSSQAIQERTIAFKAIVGKLEKHLQETPDDLEGRIMLARSYSHLGEHERSASTYAQAMTQLGERRTDLLLDYAEELAMTNKGALAGKPEEILREVLDKEPNSDKAMWMTGLARFQRGDAAHAIEIWERLEKQTPAESQEAEVLRTFMAEARASLTGNENTATPTPETAASKTQTPINKTSIKVSVSLDQLFAAQADDDDTVFVYAKAAQGPRMPLAIVRKRVADLPITVVLDDSQAMMPSMSLSNFSEVVIEARVSKSGGAMTESGDIKGSSKIINLADIDEISIVIDQVQP